MTFCDGKAMFQVGTAVSRDNMLQSTQNTSSLHAHNALHDMILHNPLVSENLTGEMLCCFNHCSMAARSYMCPSAAINGCIIFTCAANIHVQKVVFVSATEECASKQSTTRQLHPCYDIIYSATLHATATFAQLPHKLCCK